MRFIYSALLVLLLMCVSVAAAQTPVPSPVVTPAIRPSPTFEYNIDQQYEIVIARHKIWRGETITPDQLMTIEVTGSVLTEIETYRYGQIAKDVNDIAGKVALCDVLPFNPIELRKTDDERALDRLYCNYIPMQVPVAQVQTAVVPLEVGARGTLFVESDTNGLSLMLPVIPDVEVLAVDDDTVTLFVPDSLRPRTLINELIAAGATLTVSPQTPNFTDEFHFGTEE